MAALANANGGELAAKLHAFASVADQSVARGGAGKARRTGISRAERGRQIMTGDSSGDDRARLAHEARQPLNAIRLITANLQARLGHSLADEDAAWLAAKLEKIDRQVDRLARLLDPPA